MTDEQIFLIKKTIMNCPIKYPDEEDKEIDLRQRQKGTFKKFVPFIIYFLLLLAFGVLFAVSDDDVRKRILTSLFVQHLLSH